MTRFFQDFYQQWRNELLRVNESNELNELEIRIFRSTVFIMMYLTEQQQYMETIIQDIQSQIHDNEELRDSNETLQQRLIEVRGLKQNYTRQLTELKHQSELIDQQIEDKRQQLHKGLSPARIQQFHQFLADETLVGDHCGVCLDDIEVGRRMIHIDCHHVFCQDCVERWFADHNTCPNCRHIFT